MKAAGIMDEEKVVKRAINVLIKELGPMETVRFLNLPSQRKIDGVKRHRDWQKGLNKNAFFNKIFSSKGAS